MRRRTGTIHLALCHGTLRPPYWSSRESPRGRAEGGGIMNLSIRRTSTAAFFTAACFTTTFARAADDADKEDDKAEEPSGSSDDKASADEEKKEGAGSEAKGDVAADGADGNSPAELPGKTYRFIGFRYRGIIVPKFMENL